MSSSRYKHAIYLTGTRAQIGQRLFNGSQVVLKPVDGVHDLGQEQWFTPMPHPMQHYVQVAPDGSDVDDVIDKPENSPTPLMP